MDTNPTPVLVEAEPKAWSVEDALVDYANGGEISDDWLNKLVDTGYVIDVEVGALSDKGLEVAEAKGVVMREVATITLGRKVYVRDDAGHKTSLVEGSTLQVIFGGREKKTGTRYYDVLAGKDLPVLRLYHNSADTFKTYKWPSALPLKGSYKIAS